ncbi:MAG: phospholipase C, phosphocholine-specific [Acidobacteria bacterium]|nr:phospholipase C, phosphocholine-specific [Acidobacteriota bacterium]
MSTRREFFQRAGLLAAIEKAFAIDPPKGSTYLDAEHIVVLMQENRSFDHALGSLRGVRGFNDTRTVTLPDQKPVWQQTNAAGKTFAPFRLNLKETRATWLGSLPHSWRDQTDARNDGNHDKWLDAKPSGRKECAGMPFTMGYYNREDLPFYYALADAFTVCDHNFCSSLTGTTPNRLYLWTGTVREKPDGSATANVRNSDVTYTATARWTTFPERLEDAGISWRVYQNELSLPTGFSRLEDDWLSNFTDNPLEWFDQYHVGHLPTYQRELEKLAGTLPGEIAALEKKGDPKLLERKRAALKRVTAERKKWTAEAKARMTPRERQLYAKAFTTNTGDPSYRELKTVRYRDGDKERQMAVPKGDVLHQFRQDVQNGTLPTVSWVVPASHFSDHPGSPWYGAWYLAEVLNILTKNPEIWRKTIFVLTYDENDGYFDHMPPYVVPDPSNAETGKLSPGLDASVEYVTLAQDLAKHPAREARGGPIGLGYRVPMIVASPWSRGGYVCSQVFDHTSVLRLMENVLSRRTGKAIREPNISAWRRTVCGDMSPVFRPFRGGAGAALPYPSKDSVLEGIYSAQFKEMPAAWWESPTTPARQEKGTRPAVALPYELFADGGLRSDGFVLTLAAGKGAGAGFHAYTPGLFRGQAKLRTRAYAVVAGGTLSDTWALDGFADERYSVRLHGPNGFYREFAGSVDDPPLTVSCRYVGGDLELRVENHDAARGFALGIADESYGGARQRVWVGAKEAKAIRLRLAKSLRWYDFGISVEGVPGYWRRYAGHVENGQIGSSDPAMGG